MWQWAGASRGLGSCRAQPRLRFPLQLGTPSPALGTAFLPVFCKIKLNLWSSLPPSWLTDGTSKRMDRGLSLLIARDLRLVSANHVTSLLLPLTLWLFTLYWQHLGRMVCAWGVPAICPLQRDFYTQKQRRVPGNLRPCWEWRVDFLCMVTWPLEENRAN